MIQLKMSNGFEFKERKKAQHFGMCIFIRFSISFTC